MENNFLNRTSLSNPNAAILEPTHTAGRGNALDNLLKAIPSLGDMQAVIVSCPVHGKNTWYVPVAEAEAGNVECQKCKWNRDSSETLQREKRDALLQSLDMPLDHVGADFSGWDLLGDDAVRERMVRIIKFVKDYAKQYKKGRSSNLLLLGPTGTGKTKLACLIANEIVRQRYSEHLNVVFKSSAQIQQDIKATWSKTSSDTSEAYIARAGRAKVLIVDDVGQGDTSDSDRERLSTLLNERYQLNLPTIITTNMTAAEFYKHVGDRTKDRLRQNMVEIPCVWTSYRALTGRVVTL